MTPKAFFEALQDWLQAIVWGGTSNKVFGEDVFVVSEIPIEQLSRFRQPCCFIVDHGWVAHSEHPLLGIQNFSLDIFVENVHDGIGQGPILGANRVTGTSRGAGILDIEDEILSNIFSVDTLASARIRILEKSSPKSSFLRGNIPLITRAISFSAWTSLY